MSKIKPKYRYPSRNFEKWYGCELCGGEWTEATDAEGAPNGELQGFGILYREADTVVAEDGKRYCRWHYRSKYYIKNLNEAKIDIDEDNRGDEIDFG